MRYSTSTSYEIKEAVYIQFLGVSNDFMESIIKWNFSGQLITALQQYLKLSMILLKIVQKPSYDIWKKLSCIDFVNNKHLLCITAVKIPACISNRLYCFLIDCFDLSHDFAIYSMINNLDLRLVVVYIAQFNRHFWYDFPHRLFWWRLMVHTQWFILACVLRKIRTNFALDALFH